MVPTAITNGRSRLGPGDVVVLTGGARGVTAEVACALAAESQSTLVLLGRSPAPEREPTWLAGVTGEADFPVDPEPDRVAIDLASLVKAHLG